MYTCVITDVHYYNVISVYPESQISSIYNIQIFGNPECCYFCYGGVCMYKQAHVCMYAWFQMYVCL